MKKLSFLVVLAMMLSFVNALSVEARPGGLPDVAVDQSIKDCDCTLFPQCCEQPVAAPAPAPTPAPAPREEKVSMVLNVLFDTDKADVKDQYYPDVDKLADFMKTYPNTTVTIEGHTDSTGSNEYNKKLSEARAKSVRQLLIDKYGIDGSRISTIGYGEEYPIDTNDTPEGRQKNRRVEAVIEAVRIIQ
jgi:OOP family OmpA-OmpF porin